MVKIQLTIETLFRTFFSESSMGIKVNAQDNNKSDYVRSVKEACNIIIQRSLSPIEMFDFLFPFSRNYYRLHKSLKILHNYTNNVVNTRREELKNKGIESDRDIGTGIKSKKPFLDSLLKANISGQPLTQEEIREEVDTFMFEVGNIFLFYYDFFNFFRVMIRQPLP